MFLSIREYRLQELISEQCIDINSSGKRALTIGRSPTCDIRIGTLLGTFAAGISRIQSTLLVQGDLITIVDGSAKTPSKSGLYVNGEKCDRVEMKLNQPITIFKLGEFRTDLILSNGCPTDKTEKQSEEQETYLGDQVIQLSRIEGEVDNLQGSVEALQESVKSLQNVVAVNADRLQAIDENLERLQPVSTTIFKEHLEKAKNLYDTRIADFLTTQKTKDLNQSHGIKKLNRSVKTLTIGLVGLSMTTTVFFVFTISGSLTGKDREEWFELFEKAIAAVGVASTLAATAKGYLKDRQKDEQEESQEEG